MAVKYTIPYRSIDDTPWRVDILLDSWTDGPITVRGFGGNACTIEYDGGVDDPFDNPVVSSKANISLINQGELDMDELQYAGDRDFIVEVYRDNVLKWKGYLITDNIQQPLLSAPNVVHLSAIDGLNMLENIPYTHNNLQTEGQGIAVRSPLNYLRQCLFASSNLGLMLPIRWYVGMENVVTEDDAIAGMMTWSPYGDGFVVGQSSDGMIYQNCRYIVEGIVKAFGCRIFQADGAWHVMRTNDIIGGSFTYNECNATLSAPTITHHSVDISRSVSGRGQGGDYEFIREDGLLTVKPALGMVDVEYDSDKRENVIPNGGFDQALLALPIYWGYSDNPESAATMELYDSLRQDNYGNSVLLRYPVTGAPEPDNRAIFTFNGGLPIDANLLFKRMTWGFTFLPLNGFPFVLPEDPQDPTNGTIIWDEHPMRVRVSYEAKYSDGSIQTLWLNRWGYWQPEQPSGGWVDVVGVSWSSVPVVEFTGSPMRGDIIQAGFKRLPDQEQIIYTHVVEAATEGNLAATLSAWSATIPGSSNTSTTITLPDPGAGTWVLGANALSGKDNLLPGNWLDIEVQGLKIGDIASVVFQGKGGNSEILFPDPGVLDGTQSAATGVLKIEFALLEGQRYALDDVFVRLEDNNDIYRVNSPVTGNSTSQRITMGISSSFSGFMVSNMMRSYHQSNRDFVWTDGTTEASLTEHYARQVMRWRYKPSRIFNGTINTRIKDWSFIHLYLIYGFESVFLPLKARYNTELCEVDLVAMEGRDDGEITDVKHYASNNMPLSNYGGN